jgi:hypothetical protein
VNGKRKQFDTLDESIDKRDQPQAETFRFWVDKDTGILVKRELNDSNGKIISCLHPETLSINIPIDTKIFIPKLEGFNEYIEVERTSKDPREKEIEVIEHADTYLDDVEPIVELYGMNCLTTMNSHIPIYSSFQLAWKNFRTISSMR